MLNPIFSQSAQKIHRDHHNCRLSSSGEAIPNLLQSSVINVQQQLPEY